MAEVTQDLIFNEKVDMMVASSSPDTVNPAADQCEANGIPFLANFVPWQPFYFGRGATPDTPFTWTWMYHFGVEDAGVCRLGMWDQIETNKTVGYLFPNDADGQAWSDPEKGLEPILVKGGYTTGSKPEMYQPPSEDFTSQISDFKKAGCEVCTGVQTPPDFTTFMQQCAQQGYQPKIMTMSKASLFHQSIEAIGDIGIGLSDHMVWHPNFPYKSYLTGQTCEEYADAYTEETGKQWTQPLGQLGKYEWAVDVLKRGHRHRQQGPVRRRHQDHQVRGHQRPGRLHPAGDARHCPPGPERLQDQDRRRPVGEIRGSQIQVRPLHLLRTRPEHAHPEEVRSVSPRLVRAIASGPAGPRDR